MRKLAIALACLSLGACADNVPAGSTPRCDPRRAETYPYCPDISNAIDAANAAQ